MQLNTINLNTCKHIDEFSTLLEEHKYCNVLCKINELNKS